MLNWIFALTILELKRKGTCSKLLRIMVCYVKDTVFTYGGKRSQERVVEFMIWVCRNLYGLTKTEICSNTLLISILDR